MRAVERETRADFHLLPHCSSSYHELFARNGLYERSDEVKSNLNSRPPLLEHTKHMTEATWSSVSSNSDSTVIHSRRNHGESRPSLLTKVGTEAKVW